MYYLILTVLLAMATALLWAHVETRYENERDELERTPGGMDTPRYHRVCRVLSILF